MPRWIKPLVRISTYEVETIQKRLSEVVTLRALAEMKIATLDAEYELEIVRFRDDPSLGVHMSGYRVGWSMRREEAISQLAQVSMEEEGIRDQLQTAFEALQKFEHVAETTQLRKLARQRHIENAEFDETALRLSENQRAKVNSR